MNIDVTPIIQAIITLLAALVTYRLIPWIKARTTQQQQMNLQAAIRVLVYAAEQLYGAGNGAEKLEYVCQELRKRGFEVDYSAIESAVYSAFHGVEASNQPEEEAGKSDAANEDVTLCKKV